MHKTHNHGLHICNYKLHIANQLSPNSNTVTVTYVMLSNAAVYVLNVITLSDEKVCICHKKQVTRCGLASPY